MKYKKRIATIVLFICLTFFVIKLSTNQVDFEETFKNVLKSIFQKNSDLIAVRKPEYIYQNGVIVGNVRPSVGEYDDKIIFSQLDNTSKLDINAPFEYKRYKLKIVNIKRKYGRSVTKYHSYVDVLQQVECKKISD